MSKKLDAYRVGSDQPGVDLRRKLTPEQRVELHDLYHAGGTSYQKLADQFGVSKRTVIFIAKPQLLAKNRALRTAERARDYNRNSTAAMRRHRRHKRELMNAESKDEGTERLGVS